MFETEANEETVKMHPATLALARTVEKVYDSAVLTVVESTMGIDALPSVLEQQKRQLNNLRQKR